MTIGDFNTIKRKGLYCPKCGTYENVKQKNIK